MTRSKLETALAVLFAAAIILAGGAAFQSTPSDMVRFGSAMQKPGLLKAETIALLKSPLTLESGASTGFALGWKAENVPLAGTPVQVQAYWSADKLRASRACRGTRSAVRPGRKTRNARTAGTM